MRIAPTDSNVVEIEADAIVVGAYADGTFTSEATAVDEATGGILSRLREQEELKGKPNELTSLLAPQGVRANQVLVVGLGSADKVDRGVACRAAGTAAKKLAERQRTRVAFCLTERWPDETVESAIAGAMIGCHGQDLYRAEKKIFPFDELLWYGTDEAVLASGTILGRSVNLARQLVNEPPSRMNPEQFATSAQHVADECGMQIEVWDQERLEAEKCGALLAVGRGSARPPRLVVLEYHGAAGAPALALVGKGVTFDSGGLSLKTSDSMKTMKCDMAGAATVLASMQAIAELRLPCNVVGLMGLVENMVSGNSYKLGDVLTARSGKTIEVLNTDAEGRLVLADVLDVAVQRGASKIIDLATLTGACMVALGTDVAGLMTNNQQWCDEVAEAARECGEQAWQLPMFAEYAEQIKSNVADIKNVGEGRWGGAITAAKFLEEFVRERPWTHIDIAGPAFLDSSKPWLDAGGTGTFVRSLVEVARRWGA